MACGSAFQGADPGVTNRGAGSPDEWREEPVAVVCPGGRARGSWEICGMVDREVVVQNLRQVRERIEAACRACGRQPSEVRLIGVTKTLDAEAIRPALDCGLADVGENYIQELQSKVGLLPAVRWHFIGHLQRNKAALAVKLAAYIHSLDSLALIRAVDRHCVAQGRDVSGLLEVHLGGEESKSGLEPEEVWPLLEELAKEPPQRLRLVGLMTVPPPMADPDGNRPHFRQLREMVQKIGQQGWEFWQGQELSMGMSGDYQAAIAEGATMVRVGRAIFGERPPKHYQM